MKSYEEKFTNSVTYEEFLLQVTDSELTEMWMDSEKPRDKCNLI